MSTVMVTLGGELIIGPEPELGVIDPAAFITNLLTTGVQFVQAQRAADAAEDAAEDARRAAEASVEAERLRLQAAEEERRAAEARAQAEKEETAAAAQLISGIPNIVTGLAAAGIITTGILAVTGVI